MSVELDVQALANDAGDALTVPQLHDLLRRIADRIGSRPREVRGPGPDLVWALGERGIKASPSRFRGKLRVRVGAFDWEEQDAEHYRAFEYAMSLDEVPYLWSLPIAGGSTWFPGDQTATNWDDFFAAYETCMDKMPAELALLPPEWLPSGPAVTSLWNIEGSRTGGVAVSISAAGVDLFGEAPDGYLLDLRLPADRLAGGEVSVPDLLAGMTASGEYREMQYFDTEFVVVGTYPQGVKEGDPDFPPEELQPGRRPTRTQSVDEVQALLAPVEAAPVEAAPVEAAPVEAAPMEAAPVEAAPVEAAPVEPVLPAPAPQPAPTSPIPAPAPGPAPQPPHPRLGRGAAEKPARKPFWRRRNQVSPTAWVSTMPVAHVLELATQLVLNNADSQAVLAAWEVTLDEQGNGRLRSGLVQIKQGRSGGFNVLVELMPTDQQIDDQVGAAAYTSELVAALTVRFGAPSVVSPAGGSCTWAWKVGTAGLVVESHSTRVAIVSVADGDYPVNVLRQAPGAR